MNEKLPLLQEAIKKLKDKNTSLAEKLSELVTNLLKHIENKKTDDIKESEKAIDTFLEEHEKEVTIGDWKKDLTALFSEVQTTESETTTEPPQKTSRRSRSRKKILGRGAAITGVFAVLKRRDKKAPHTTTMEPVTSTPIIETPVTSTPVPTNNPVTPSKRQGNREHLPVGTQRQRVIQEMDKIIAANKRNPIGYDFNDTELKKDRDINCSGLVYEIIQRRAGFKICSGGITSAALYQSMLDKGRPCKPLLRSGESAVNIAGILPGDTVFRASKKDFARNKGGRPAKVNGMPIHHSAIIQSVSSDGSFTVLESTGSTGVQVKTYTAQRWLEKRQDELHVVRVPYDQVA